MARSKKIRCKICGMKFPKNRKKCPNCGARQSMGGVDSSTLKKILIVVILFFAFCIIVSTCSTSDGKNAQEPENDTSVSEPSDYSGADEIDKSKVSPDEGEPQENEWATEFTPINDFRYSLDKDAETITMLKYKGHDTKIMMSPVYTIDGVDYKLVSLGEEACFFGEISITSVYIPEGVTYMSANCFNSCASLQYLYIPESMNNLESGFLDYLHGYTVHYDSSISIPGERDTNNYDEMIDDASTAEKNGESMGGAVNGLVSGLLSGMSEDNEKTVEIYYGGSEERWNSIK